MYHAEQSQSNYFPLLPPPIALTQSPQTFKLYILLLLGPANQVPASQPVRRAVSNIISFYVTILCPCDKKQGSC